MKVQPNNTDTLQETIYLCGLHGTKSLIYTTINGERLYYAIVQGILYTDVKAFAAHNWTPSSL